MQQHTVTFQPGDLTVQVRHGDSLLQAQIAAGLHPDAPCGGKGTCGKCRVILEGREVLACQTAVDRDMTVSLKAERSLQILSGGISVHTVPDGTDDYVLAFDVGTTTLVGYLLNGVSGVQMASASCRNPQGQFGADVISRIQHALKEGGDVLSSCVRKALSDLTRFLCQTAGISPNAVTRAAIAGNTAMHHLLLQIDPKPLITPPYMPAVSDALEVPAGEILPIGGSIRILPNIAGFVGGDTVSCMVSTRFDTREDLTLLIDIGTNGEMVLGNRHRRIACSTAAGPAFEGAKISCGMRGAEGAVDHVFSRDGGISCHVIGGTEARGLCGSGLLDLVAVLLDQGIISPTGRMQNKVFSLSERVSLTQKDVREVQLAKAAIRAGIELMAQQLGVQISDIRTVWLAGAFGSYLDPRSACRIGLIPPELLDRITPIGNAAGEGAKLCALRRSEFDYSRRLARNTEFLELASLPQFQDQYIQRLNFSEDDE